MKRILLLLTLLGASCQGDKPHRVTDLSSGRVYYTKRWRRGLTTGSVYIEDAKGGDKIVIPSSKVEKISEEEYQRGASAK